MRVLVVEDERKLGHVLRKALEAEDAGRRRGSCAPFGPGRRRLPRQTVCRSGVAGPHSRGAPGFSRETLARDMWREPQRATPLNNVIDVQITRLCKKVDADTEQRLIHTVRGVGFVVREGEP